MQQTIGAVLVIGGMIMLFWALYCLTLTQDEAQEELTAIVVEKLRERPDQPG